MFLREPADEIRDLLLIFSKFFHFILPIPAKAGISSFNICEEFYFCNNLIHIALISNYCIKLHCINIQYFLSEVKQEIMEFFEGYLQGNFGVRFYSNLFLIPPLKGDDCFNNLIALI